jgi:TctA family transporter
MKQSLEEAGVNWKLIFLLTLFGVAIAFAGVLGLPGRIEAYIWLFVFVIYAAIIVRKTTGKYFLHAFAACTISGVWIGIIHAIFISTYLADHHVIRQVYKMMPLSHHRRLLSVIMGTIIGVLMGIIAGLIAHAFGKITKKRKPEVRA